MQEANRKTGHRKALFTAHLLSVLGGENGGRGVGLRGVLGVLGGENGGGGRARGGDWVCWEGKMGGGVGGVLSVLGGENGGGLGGYLVCWEGKMGAGGGLRCPRGSHLWRERPGENLQHPKGSHPGKVPPPPSRFPFLVTKGEL